jgi:hypothetical protein
MSNNTRIVILPADLCSAAEKKFNHRFGDVSEMLIAVMTTLLREDVAAMDEGEQKIIEERLKGLGYI